MTSSLVSDVMALTARKSYRGQDLSVSLVTEILTLAALVLSAWIVTLKIISYRALSYITKLGFGCRALIALSLVESVIRVVSTAVCLGIAPFVIRILFSRRVGAAVITQRIVPMRLDGVKSATLQPPFSSLDPALLVVSHVVGEVGDDRRGLITLGSGHHLGVRY